MEKITDIRQNIKESIVVILCAMQELGIELEHPENTEKREYILQEAATQEREISDVSIILLITKTVFQETTHLTRGPETK